MKIEGQALVDLPTLMGGGAVEDRSAFDFIAVLVQTIHAIDSVLQPQKQGNYAFEELARRMSIAEKAIDFTFGEEKDKNKATRCWSDIWREHLTVHVKPRHNFGHFSPSCDQMLQALREHSVEPLIYKHVDEILGLASKSKDLAALETAQEFRGSLPSGRISRIIDCAAQYSRVKVMLQKESQGKTVGLCELSCVKKESAILRPPVTAEVTVDLANLDKIWERVYSHWLTQSDNRNFATLHKKFQLAYAAISSSQWKTAAPWLEQQLSAETQAEIAEYQTIVARNLTVHRMALAVLPYMGAEHKDQVNEIADICETVKYSEEHIKCGIASVYLGSILLRSPRPPTFEKDLEQGRTFVKEELKVKDKLLPAFVQTLINGAKLSGRTPSVVSTTSVESACPSTRVADGDHSSVAMPLSAAGIIMKEAPTPVEAQPARKKLKKLVRPPSEE